MSATNGGLNGAVRHFKTLVEIAIVILQTIMILFLVDIRDAVKDHDRRIGKLEVLVPKAEASMEEHAHFRERIGELETFAAKGGRWSIEDQVEHERQMLERITEIWRALGTQTLREVEPRNLVSDGPFERSEDVHD